MQDGSFLPKDRLHKTSYTPDGAGLRASVEQGHISHDQAMHVLHHLQRHSWNMHLGSYLCNRFVGYLNSNDLNCRIYQTLAGPKSFKYRMLTAGLYAVGFVSRVFVSTYRTVPAIESSAVFA